MDDAFKVWTTVGSAGTLHQADLATSRRKIDVCGIVVNRLQQRKPRRGDRRGPLILVVVETA
jgi:hypothetical protein